MHAVRASWQAWAERDAEPGFVSIVHLGDDRFVTAPDDVRARVEAADPRTAGQLVEALGAPTVARSGAAHLAYADRMTFRPRPSGRVVVVGADDPRFSRLRADADPEEWGESFGQDERAHCVGIVHDDALVSIAGYRLWDDALAHVAVFTAAAQRARGLSTEVASAAIAHALEAGLVPQWRARVGNTASIRVAEKLGLVTLGTQLFARLEEPPDPLSPEVA